MKIRKINLIYFVFISLIVSPLFGQNVDEYLQEIQQGHTARAKAALPELLKQYPKDPGVKYLQGVLETDGETAYQIFKKIADASAQNPYQDDAIMQVGEYLYARGLYISAEKYLKKIPYQYPESPYVETATDLWLNSLVAAGKSDSAKIVRQTLSKKFPELTFNNPNEKISGQSEEEAEKEATTAPEPVDLTKKNPYVKSDQSQQSTNGTKDYYTLQVGAFSTLDNAVSQKKMFESNGVKNVEVRKRQRGKVELYLVWVGHYKTHDAAEQAGESIKNRINFPYFVVHVDE